MTYGEEVVYERHPAPLRVQPTSSAVASTRRVDFALLRCLARRSTGRVHRAGLASVLRSAPRPHPEFKSRPQPARTLCSRAAGEVHRWHQADGSPPAHHHARSRNRSPPRRAIPVPGSLRSPSAGLRQQNCSRSVPGDVPRARRWGTFRRDVVHHPQALIAIVVARQRRLSRRARAPIPRRTLDRWMLGDTRRSPGRRRRALNRSRPRAASWRRRSGAGPVSSIRCAPATPRPVGATSWCGSTWPPMSVPTRPAPNGGIETAVMTVRGGPGLDPGEGRADRDG